MRCATRTARACPARRSSTPRRALASLVSAAGLAWLAGCGGDPNSFAPADPETAPIQAAPAGAGAAPASRPHVPDNHGGPGRPDGAAAAARPPTLEQAPADVTTTAGMPVQFHVRARGEHPIAYQWLRDGEPIAGATQAQLVFTASLDDGGSTYSVMVRDVNGHVESAPATLRLLPTP